MLAKFKERIYEFASDCRGSIAILFALVALILFGIAGAAIDTGRAMVAKTRLSTALDAASLAAAKGLRLQNLTNSEVIALAQKVFNANMQGNKGTTEAKVKSFKVTVDRDKVSVKIDIEAEMDTVLARVIGVDKFKFPRTSAAIFESKDIEVAVQLDVTGSMCSPCTKMDALKKATKSMIDILIPDIKTGRKVRVGFAPFSGGVNAGPFAASVTDGMSSAAGSTCVFERRNPSSYELSDDLPTGLGRLMARNEVNSGNRGNCSATAQILPMTDDKATLKSTVDSYMTSGWTAGHIGSTWAWYLLSPKWATIWPSSAKPEPYNDGKTIKVAVLMTDGQYNTYNGYSNGTKSRTVAKDVCAAMKAKGIRIYTVGFQLSSAATKDVMNSCASSSSNAFEAKNEADLIQAFQSIAVDISRLRLSS